MSLKIEGQTFCEIRQLALEKGLPDCGEACDRGLECPNVNSDILFPISTQQNVVYAAQLPDILTQIGEVKLTIFQRENSGD